MGQKGAKFELFAAVIIIEHNQRQVSYFLGLPGVQKADKTKQTPSDGKMVANGSCTMTCSHATYKLQSRRQLFHVPKVREIPSTELLLLLKSTRGNNDCGLSWQVIQSDEQTYQQQEHGYL